MKYSDANSVIVILSRNQDKWLDFPCFKMSGHVFKTCSQGKSGHIITDILTDDEDNFRRCGTLNVQAKVLSDKFSHFSDYARLTFFKAYCTPLCTAHLCQTTIK